MIPYEAFIDEFLMRVTEYKFLALDASDRDNIVRSYLKAAVAQFKSICKYDLTATANDGSLCFEVDIEPEDVDEIVDIISEGMLVQWMKPYLYNQENWENVLNTKDYASFSPAELSHRTQEAYRALQTDFKNKMKEYSYNHGEIRELHI